MRRLPRLASLAVPAAVALVALGGCSQVSDALDGSSVEEAQRDEASGEITEAADADVFSIKVGDCLDLSNGWGTEVYDVPVTPCGDPHDSEVYSVLQMTGADLPVDVDDQAMAYCESEFETFVGTAWLDSALEYTYLAPSEDSWSAGDREVLCILQTTGDPVTTTLQGSGL